MLGQRSRHCQSGEYASSAHQRLEVVVRAEIVLCFALRVSFAANWASLIVWVVLEFPRNQPGRATTPLRSTAEFDPRGVRLSPASGTVMPETQVRDGGNGHARTQTARTS